MATRIVKLASTVLLLSASTSFAIESGGMAALSTPAPSGGPTHAPVTPPKPGDRGAALAAIWKATARKPASVPAPESTPSTPTTQPVAAPVDFDAAGALVAEPALPATRVAAAPAQPLSMAMTLQLSQVAPVASQPADAGVEPLITLEEALAIAVRDNRGVRTASIEIDRAADRIGAARTRRYPAIRVGVEADYPVLPIDLTFQKGDFGTFPGTGPIPSQETTLRTQSWLAAATAGVVQPLSQQWRLGLIINQLGVQQSIAREDLREQQQAVANDVKRAYYLVLQAQSTREAILESVRSLVELDRVVTEQLAERKVLRADSLEVKARLAQAESDAFTATNDLASRKELLNHLMGRDPSEPFRVEAVPEVSLAGEDLEAALLQALQQRPELAKADLQVRAAEYDARIKRAEFIPDLDLVFRYAHPATNDRLPQNIALAGVSLSWEIFDWGRKSREAAERDRAAEQAKTSAAETRSRIILDVKTRFRKLEEAKSRLRVAELGRAAARERVEVATARYGERVVLLADVLQAQAALAAANDQQQGAVLAFWTARADFDRALGEGQ
jgi:outer membrane protein TolC